MSIDATEAARAAIETIVHDQDHKKSSTQRAAEALLQEIRNQAPFANAGQVIATSIELSRAVLPFADDGTKSARDQAMRRAMAGATAKDKARKPGKKKTTGKKGGIERPEI